MIRKSNIYDSKSNRSVERSVYLNTADATLYTSPYLVATRHGYTKHYYTENERVASRIGGGGLHGLTMTGKDDFQELLQPELPLHHPSCIPNNDEFKKKCDNATKYAIEVARCLDSEIRAYAPLESLAPFSDILNEKPDCYWYHTDHLGSSSWITYTDGTAVEHLHYLPWGEDLVRQRHTNYHARYTFSGKEKDTETGYSYFGSRYYSSDLSIWLSVDPQSDKYPSLSPYVYCANNPVKLVDPNGEEIASPDDPPKRNTSSNQQPSNSMLPYYKQEYEKADNITTKLHYGLKIVGEKLNFDEQNFVDAAGSILQGAVLFNPLVGITNDIKIVSSGTDIYGNQSNLADRIVSGIDAVTFGAAKTFKYVGGNVFKGYEKTFNAINKLTTSYSFGNTIINKETQTKNKDNNAKR